MVCSSESDLVKPAVGKFCGARVDEANVNEFGRFDVLRASVDVQRAKTFFEQRDHMVLPMRKVRMRATRTLRRFILAGGFDIDAEEHDED